MARKRRGKTPRIFLFSGEHLTITNAPMDRLIIGRHRQCHIRIPLEEVNLKHAVIERIGVQERWRVLNFGEEMPTLFNDEMMEKGEARELTFGDVFEIGEYAFYFQHVRRDAPEEHQDAFEQVIEAEKSGKNKRFSKARDVEDDDDDDDGEYVEDGQVTAMIDDDDDDGEGGEDAKGPPKIKARRRRRRGLKSSARRKRSLGR